MNLRRLKLFPFLLFLAGILILSEGLSLGEESQLPLLHPPGAPYRTPRAGEGFRTEVLGHRITVQPQNRRSVSAWEIGAEINKPAPEDASVLPFGTLYFWRHPDDKHLLRIEATGIANDVFWAHSPQSSGSFEWVLTFNNFTLPFAKAELVDGRALKSEELLWGYVRPGFGLGFRKQVAPGHQDNMLSVDLTVEPGFLFFDKSSKTADNFAVPHDTFELRSHLQVQLDAVERNLLELAHRGIASGADLVYGHRLKWGNWGLNNSEGADGRNYLSLTGFFLAAGGVPGIQSERHRLLGSVHGGIGSRLDRFSAPRIGGGPIPMGEEYGSTSMPILPGASFAEFYPKHYLLAVGEYRWEPVFFTYVGLTSSIGWLDRLRITETGISRKDDVLSSIGARVTTGFFFNTRLQLAYNYNFSVVRHEHFGGHEIVAVLTGKF